eukprot:TRINITY_DN18608_c0_g1_i2.p1 TRINITY_DN18608_c0_g1~~TRINITY_DN18608_c0_g1_i2.p1  ORF type:complete len:243 (-),score=74.85 TRINITY_DN18608_c0_g1_i2:862-1590(-)
MTRRPPRSTLSSSSAASDVYKRQESDMSTSEKNPLPWPSFQQLGRDIYDTLNLPLSKLEGAAAEDSPADPEEEALCSRLLQRVSNWIESPCYATVKLDGSNCGVDNAGMFVGRTTVVAPGQTYQKLDIRSMLGEYPSKAEALRKELEASGEGIAQLMLYGELCVMAKHDYMDCGIHRTWLCFGAVLRPQEQDEGAATRLCEQLRVAGYNAGAHQEGVVWLSINQQLSGLLEEQGVSVVAAGG